MIIVFNLLSILLVCILFYWFLYKPSLKDSNISLSYLIILFTSIFITNYGFKPTSSITHIGKSFTIKKSTFYYTKELSELTRQVNDITYPAPDLLRSLFILIVILVRFTTIIVDSDLEKRFSNFYILVFTCIFFSICCFNTDNLF